MGDHEVDLLYKTSMRININIMASYLLFIYLSTYFSIRMYSKMTKVTPEKENVSTGYNILLSAVQSYFLNFRLFSFRKQRLAKNVFVL